MVRSARLTVFDVWRLELVPMKCLRTPDRNFYLIFFTQFEYFWLTSFTFWVSQESAFTYHIMRYDIHFFSVSVSLPELLSPRKSP